MSVETLRSRPFERYAVAAALVLLLLGCYLVVRPFLTAFLWGAIIAVSTRGLYDRVVRLVRGKRGLAATLTSLALVAVLLVPIIVVALKVVTAVPPLGDRLDEMLQTGLHDPPAWVAGIPIIGKGADAQWRIYAADPERLRQALRPYWKPVKDFVLTAVGGLSLGILEFALALFIAGLLYAKGEAFAKVVDRVAYRLGGESGRRQINVVRSTVRGVFKGILGTCAVQAVLAMIGFWVSGVPRPFILGMGTFFLSVVPGGPAILWIPAALWLNAKGSGGWAIFLALWGLIIVGGSDNVVRPLLIGRGVEAPMAIIFLGVVGGILAFGFLGLFIGPTLLSIAYNLFQEWMGEAKERAAGAATT
jgi:predicted PurR-regulated permease PerM